MELKSELRYQKGLCITCIEEAYSVPTTIRYTGSLSVKFGILSVKSVRVTRRTFIRLLLLYVTYVLYHGR